MVIPLCEKETVPMQGDYRYLHGESNHDGKKWTSPCNVSENWAVVL